LSIVERHNGDVAIYDFGQQPEGLQRVLTRETIHGLNDQDAAFWNSSFVDKLLEFAEPAYL
jgi:hypothetical protein